ncbi:MAG TPA: Gfo/Idh/MocA family oxidoreductase [Casimicrobiaceae bacterium]|nr:Gfo/Idh/MocA family oxidoreductase [Casimicrobiaceae bacterium]
MNKIGFALIGAGTIGRVHARNIAEHPDTRLHWVVDIDAKAGKALAAAHGAKFSTSVDQMLEDPQVQAIVIGSSTDVHEAHLLASVRAGKAVLCEKPIADSLERAKNCLAAARAANVVAAIGFNRRFDAHHRAVYDRVRAGEIGAVESVHIVSRSGAAIPPAAAHRAGGMLREKGTHFYDLAHWMTASEPVEVYAAGGCVFDRGYAAYGDVDTAALTLRFASGALATFSFSRRTTFGYDEMIELFGSKGMLQSERQPAPSASRARGARALGESIHPTWYDRFAPTYVAELEAMVIAIRTGKPIEPDLVDGMRAQAVAEAAVESLARGKPVAIADVWRVK